jgi:phenylacetate-CoA ligase
MSGVGALHALVRQLDESQWAPRDALRDSQLRHVARLADFCAGQSPYFSRRLAQAGLAPADLGTADGFNRLPVMTRRDAQQAGADLYCVVAPATHGAVSESATSGSTGEPIVARRTAVSALFANAMVVRELSWHQRELSGRLCTVGARVREYVRHPDWGAPATSIAATGEALSLPVTADVGQLAAWIRDFDPTLLVIYPSTLRALVKLVSACRITFPALRQVLTTGETLSEDLRPSVEAVLGASLVDCYSSEEFGCIAAQCPDGNGYHVMAEALLVEVLDRSGRPCAPGEVGRITVTDLHNYATPFVRYDIGDVAEVAPPCSCGRGLPTLARILGRERNLIVLRDGRRHWPVTGLLRVRDVVPVAQYQVVQESVERVEMRLVSDRELTRDEEQRLKAMFRDTVGYPFDIRLRYFTDRIPTGPSGKFEEFVSLVETD